MRSMMRRIRRLKAGLPPAPPPRIITDEERLFSAGVATLLSRMDPAQASLVREDWKNFRERKDCAHLTGAVVEKVWHHVTEDRPLALPPDVGAIYIAGEYSTEYECEDCGYELPIAWPNRNEVPPTPLRVYFPKCPLCGGNVEGHAFWRKHKYYTPRELKAAAGRS